ncbi:hypothetical protein Ahy_B03g065719 [Arachis hypogaea]|uniref:Protein FAR1-RELATED SEQUENCE n=1 Tax=Arachis hypogaea TaxID=3818 RepID=A0A445A294_ARAHY|nr:hypothetical protein Ahy_B03g065719 [Arachis hypogaea]
MECECSQRSSEGISCSHIFCAMKRVGLQKLPDSILLKRWSKDAKKYLDESSTGGTVQDKEREFLMCYGALSVATTWMVFLGTQNGPSFHDTMNETKTLEQKSGLKRQTRDSPMPNFLGDPSVVKTKGAPKEKKREKNCSVRSDDDDSGDKTGSGTQANFGIKEELPKNPMASQGTSPVLNTELGFGLGGSGLNNSHGAPIPPYGSCTTRRISEVQWNAVALPSIITPARDRKSVTIELTDAKTKEPTDTMEKNIYLYSMLFSGRPSNGLTLSKAIDAAIFDA